MKTKINLISYFTVGILCFLALLILLFNLLGFLVAWNLSGYAFLFFTSIAILGHLVAIILLLRRGEKNKYIWLNSVSIILVILIIVFTFEFSYTWFIGGECL